MNNLPLDVMKKITENQVRNLETMKHCEPANSLVMRYRNKAAVIVAAGPSLDNNIKLLREIQSRDDTIVIAVDAALAPMRAADLNPPHFVTSVDYQDVTTKKFFHENQNCELFGKTFDLIFIPEVSHIVPKIYPVGNYYAYLGVSYKAIFDKILGVDCVYCHVFNCSNLALWAAQVMGCDPIIFIGHDFQFTDGRDHAEGTILNQGNIHHDEKPYADDAKANTEAMIKAMVRTYINATEGGAGIVGAEDMTFSEAIKRIGRKKYDLAMEMKKLILDVRHAQKKKDPKKVQDSVKRFGADSRVHMLAGLLRSRGDKLSFDLIEAAANDMIGVLGRQGL